jgi:hypothetical protein
MMTALHRRAIEGGSYQVKLSAARNAMWVQELSLLNVAAQGEVPQTAGYRPRVLGWLHPSAGSLRKYERSAGK